MTKFKDELPESILDEDFNSLSILYKQKEAKYTKPFEYFLSMRNKELGLAEPEVEASEHDSSEQLTKEEIIEGEIKGGQELGELEA